MRTALFASSFSVMFTLSALAQPAVSPADLPSRIVSGDTISVLDTMSRETRGVLGTLSDTMLTLMVDGKLRDISFSEVRRITRIGRDPLWNGILIGAGVGALAGASLGHGPGVAVQGAVIYGAIGALIDRARRGRVEVYRAPAGPAVRVLPIFSPGQQGIRVSLSF